MVFHIFDVEIVKPWLLRKKNPKHLGIPKSKQSGLATLKVNVAFSVMNVERMSSKKRERPPSAFDDKDFKKKNTGNATKPNSTITVDI